MTADCQIPDDDHLDEGYDLPSVTKHNWKSKASRDHWEDRLTSDDTTPGKPGTDDARSAADAFGEIWHEIRLDAITDADHPKQAGLVTIAPDAFGDVMTDLSERGLSVKQLYTTSPGFSTHTDDGNHVRAVVAESQQVVDDYHAAWDDDDHEERGRLHGFPECCASFWSEQWDAGYGDPIYQAACNTPSAEQTDELEVTVQDPNALLNPVWRYLDWRFVEHVPCSFECERSVELGSEYGRLMREAGYGDEAEALWEMLGAPATWSGYHGLAHVRNGYCIGEYVTDDHLHEKTVIWHEPHEELTL